MGLDANTCSSIVDTDSCPNVDSSTCDGFKDPGLYWLIAVLSYFISRTQSLLTMAFFDTYEESMGEAQEIADTVASLDDNGDEAMKKVLTIISEVLGFASAGLVHIPLGMNITEEEDDVRKEDLAKAGELIDLLGQSSTT